jgi:hypothetical protein
MMQLHGLKLLRDRIIDSLQTNGIRVAFNVELVALLRNGEGFGHDD